MELTITHFLQKMLTSTEKNIQLDIFRENGEVLLQIFKSDDVKNWDVDFVVTQNALVFQLLFNGGKTDNKANQKRFLEAEISEDFEKVEFYNQETYFANFPITMGIETIENIVGRTIAEVYDLELLDIHVTLNAY